MKARLLAQANYYMVLTIAFLPVPILIRIYELVKLTSKYTLPPSSLGSLLLGTGVDLLFFFSLALVLVPVFLILSRINKTFGSIFYVGFLFLVSFVCLLLSSYFTVTLIPLDQVIFSYTGNEIIQIVMNSAQVDIIGILIFILMVAMPLLLIRLLRNVRFSISILLLFAMILAGSPIVLSRVYPDRKDFSREFDYFLSNNKLQYGVRAISNHLTSSPEQRTSLFASNHDNGSGPGDGIKELSSQFQEKNRGFIYLNGNYPFLRLDNTPDVLGPYFNLKEEKPNIVFVIVESLTPSFCGLDPYYGSFMPFLDSLITASLYWENILATSERTFGVLPAIFGSLPYTPLWNGEKGDMPNHFSLIRYLKENGYYSNFFYGSDPAFSNYEGFLKREGVDYSLNTFGEAYQENIIFSTRHTWGFPDGDLFRRSFEVLDSFPHSPRLDIYLTVSMHFPFTVPGQDTYLDNVSERINRLGLDEKKRAEVEKSAEVFSSILYTDDMLRNFFGKYRKQPGFDNTIFIITGDHSMPELSSSWETPSEKYHVPLIIYSPLLKETGQFKAISSHLDITPSILSLLKLPYDLKTHPYCHWLGSALDVSQQTKYSRSIAFVRNNRTYPDYFRDPYFLSFNLLSKMDQDQYLVPYHDSLLLKEMEQEQALFQSLSQYAIENNALIPGSIFFKDELTKTSIIPEKTTEFDNSQIASEFVRIFMPTQFSENYENIQVNITMKMKSHQPDSLKLPQLILEVLDSNFTSYLYSEFFLEEGSTYIRGDSGWGSVKINKRVDLGFIKQREDKWMKVYIWNRNTIPLQLDSLEVTIDGFYMAGENTGQL